MFDGNLRKQWVRGQKRHSSSQAWAICHQYHHHHHHHPRHYHHHQACFQPISVFFPWFVDGISNTFNDSQYIGKFEIFNNNIDIEAILKNINIIKGILENIDIDEILNQLEFGIYRTGIDGRQLLLVMCVHWNIWHKTTVLKFNK